MKRFVCLILSAVLLFALCSCDLGETDKSVHFYYLRSEYTHGTPDSVIAAEERELSGNYEPADLLRQYLKGPQENIYKTPFPANTTLTAFENNEDTVYITLSDQIGKLTGLSLSLACACLAKTAMELTGANTVQISAGTISLNGKDFITLDVNSILLLDSGTAVTNPVTE